MAAEELTKAELRGIYDALSKRGDLPELQRKLQRMIAQRATEVVRGVLVFAMELELSKGVTLNRYAQMEAWMRANLYKEVDADIQTAMKNWPACRAIPARRREVVVTRYSSRAPDEISIDVIGGKVPIDRLVIVGILSGDTETYLLRTPKWEPVKPKLGKLRVEVFEVHGWGGLPPKSGGV